MKSTHPGPAALPGPCGRSACAARLLAALLVAALLCTALPGGAMAQGAQGAAPGATEKEAPAALPEAPGAEAEATPEAAPVAAPSAKPRPPVRLFGTVEFRSPIKNLPKWERVRGAEGKSPSFTASGLDAKNPQVGERWAKLKETLKDASFMEQARGVNKFFNQWPYKTDMELWGVEDYWETPREFVQKSGDCEDYAISKYYALRDLGVEPARMRIAAVKDGIRGLGHAVLVVFVENDAYILDNLTNLVLSHVKLKHYQLYYTVNEEYLWRHVKPKPGTGRK